ncbi:MAG: FkbM family methyltransferase [Clostridia bacterium]
MEEFQIYTLPYGKFLLSITANDDVTKCLRYGEFWEKELKEIFDNNLTKEDIVIEIGSYIGDHTVYLSKLCKKVFAFEPTLRNYYQLCANLLLNNCTNVVVSDIIIANDENVRVALEEDGDKFYLDFENNAAGVRFIPCNGKPIDHKKVKTTRRIDTLINDANKIKLLKVDAEGMDLSVLRGSINLINCDKPIIIFEYNGYVSQDKFSEYEKFLIDINYDYKQIGPYNWLATWKG